jgi:hypothetical protein
VIRLFPLISGGAVGFVLGYIASYLFAQWRRRQKLCLDGTCRNGPSSLCIDRLCAKHCLRIHGPEACQSVVVSKGVRTRA